MDILIAFGTTVITSLVKNTIKPKFGDTGVHIFVFILALIGVSFYTFVFQVNPDVQTFVTEAIKTLTYAVALYEVILKKTGIF